MSYGRAALYCPEFDHALHEVPSGLRAFLQERKLDKASVLKRLTRQAPGSEESWADLRRILGMGGVDPAKVDDWTHDLGLLHGLASGLAPEAAVRYAHLSGHEVSADLLAINLSKREAEEARDLRRLALHSLAHLPSEWRGKRYRRTEGRGSEHAREEGERAERLRKAKEVIGLLLEAGLPFSH